MATGNNGGDELLVKHQVAELSKTLKEGERIIAPTRRPDGTFRKSIRIRAGYTPQDEVAIYQPKGALMKKEMASQVGPPGYDPTLDAKPKTKNVKRNERKKEKRLQAALEKEKNSEQVGGEESSKEEEPVLTHQNITSESDLLVSRISELAVSADTDAILPPSDSAPDSNPGDLVQDIDKRIRALKKKIRLTDAQKQKTPQQDLNPEQSEKFSKLESWRQELKLLEDRKAELTES